MTNTTPGILYIFFYEDERYQLWGFTITPETSEDIQTSWDDGDWMENIFEDITTEHCELEVASASCDEVHGIGMFSNDADFDTAPVVMNAWRDRIAEELGDDASLGDVKMIQEGCADTEGDPEFNSDADIYALCLEA